jgi:hypothetical protein
MFIADAPVLSGGGERLLAHEWKNARLLRPLALPASFLRRHYPHQVQRV